MLQSDKSNMTNRRFLRWFNIYAVAWAPIACAYLAIVLATSQISLSQLAATVFSNIFFPFILGIAVYGIMLRWLVSERFWIQVIAHIFGSIAFSFVWANALFRALQIVRGTTTGDWSFQGFTGAALLWQLLQGVTLYFMIAAGTYAVWLYDQVQQNIPETENKPDSFERPILANPLHRLFARSGGDILPIDFAEVTYIQGADDYSEIFTKDGNRHVRMALKDFEARLDPAKFIRVHRSFIVNTDKILSVESAGGGRLSMHLSGGATITASRAGSQAFRERII